MNHDEGMSEDAKLINQYLTFQLEDELYAFPVTMVREVLEYQDMRKIPRMPDFLRGIINVRDSVVPVVDFRIRFGFPTKEKTLDTSIIVVELDMGDHVNTLGLLVDSVNEVIEIDSTTIETSKNFGLQMNTSFIKGIGRQEENFVIIVDLHKAFAEEELQEIQDNFES